MKNTNCPFQMVVKLKQESCCAADIELEHNQSVQSLEASHFRDVPPYCVERVYQLFESGHTPSTARASILTGHSSILQRRIELPQEEGSDTSVVPRRRYFNYLYTRTQFCKGTLWVGGGRGLDVLKTCGKSSCSLRKRILKQPHVTKYPGQIYEGDNIPLTIAIATPLMKRVHEKHRTRSSDMPVNFLTWTTMSSHMFLYYSLTF